MCVGKRAGPRAADSSPSSLLGSFCHRATGDGGLALFICRLPSQWPWAHPALAAPVTPLHSAGLADLAGPLLPQQPNLTLPLGLLLFLRLLPRVQGTPPTPSLYWVYASSLLSPGRGLPEGQSFE